MAHVRAQIRDAIATALAGATPTVRKSRAYAVQSYPIICVYAEQEFSEQGRMGGGTVVRTLRITVEAAAQAPVDTLDDTLDGYAVEIETALGDNTLGGLVKTMYLSETEIAFDASGDKVLGLLRMTFTATYGTTKADPENTR